MEKVATEKTDGNSLVKLSFEGKDLLAVRGPDGRQFWIVQQVGEVLGYADVTLSKLIRDGWADEFEQGVDFDVIEGNALRELKKALVPHYGISAQTPALLVLYESGIHTACIKTDKPAGKRLRRWLAREVLPSIRVTGSYAAAPVDPALALDLDVRLRESRLQQARYLERFLDTLRSNNQLSPQNEITWGIQLAELATGQNLIALRPAVDHVGWKTPTDIARELGVTPQRVGMSISALGLRRHVPGKVEQYQTKAETCDRIVDCWRYAPEVAEQIKAHVGRPLTVVRGGP